MVKKTQGFNKRLDESLGARNKTKGTQSLASRRKESEDMEKSMGRRKYAAVGTMDKGKKGTGKRKKSSSGSSSLISQHKRMAMGEKITG